MRLKRIFIIGTIFPVLFSIVLFFGILISGEDDDSSNSYSPVYSGMNLSADVLKHQPMVEKYARENGISEYVNVLLAIIQMESGGTATDVMQSSESLGLPPNSLSTEESIKQGCKYFASLLSSCKAKGMTDINVVIQSYNYGGGYADYVAIFFRNVMRRRNTEFRKEMEETSAKVMEMVELIPVTRAHALEEEEVHKMSGQLFAVAEKGYKLDIIQSLFGSVGWAIFQVFQVVCLAFTGVLALRAAIQPGDITLYQSYFSTIVSQVSSLMSLIPTIAKGIESVNSIGEVLLEEDVEHNEGKKKLAGVHGDFCFENVKFHYNNTDKNVLNDLNLTVHQGETIALVGESGAGKSTILNLVIGFNFATDGKVLVDGEDISQIDLRSYRKHLAVVPQTSILFSGTIRDNITYGIENVSEEQLQEVVKAANLTDLIESLPKGLDTMVGEHGGKLSGGQRQRISIARALIRNPQVIVLDEATSALDSISEKLIQEALNNLTKGRTTFIVAHRLSTIRDADKIAVIADGHCVEYGTFEELMALKGEFYQMKSIQS